MRNIQSSWLLRAAIASLLPVAPPAVLAQAPSMTVEGLEEILVTARKRDEALLDVPVAVNAFTMPERIPNVEFARILDMNSKL